MLLCVVHLFEPTSWIRPVYQMRSDSLDKRISKEEFNRIVLTWICCGGGFASEQDTLVSVKAYFGVRLPKYI